MKHHQILLLAIVLVMSELIVSGNDCIAPAVKNGRYKMRLDFIRYRCSRGFKRVGPRTALCLDGSWFPTEIPVCVSKAYTFRSGCDGLSRNNRGWALFTYNSSFTVINYHKIFLIYFQASAIDFGYRL